MPKNSNSLYTLFMITPEEVVFEGKVRSLSAPGEDGYLEILAHHAPLITPLKKGKLTITIPSDQKQVYQVSGGILEVSRKRCTVLLDQVESASG